MVGGHAVHRHPNHTGTASLCPYIPLQTLRRGTACRAPTSATNIIGAIKPHGHGAPCPGTTHHHTSAQSKQLYGRVPNLPLHVTIQHNAVPRQCNVSPYVGARRAVPLHPIEQHQHNKTMPTSHRITITHRHDHTIVGAGSEPAPTRRNPTFGWCSGAPSPVFPNIRAQHRCAPTLQCITVRWGTACRAPTSHRTSSDRRTLDGYWMHLRKRCSMYVPRFSC
jgi:hypothetical protein